MGAKATFNAVTRRITLIEAPISENGDQVVDLDVKTDLYSDGKGDWLATEGLRRVRFPIRAVGGDSRPGGKLGSSFFLRNDWKIQPYSASHRLRVVGNLYSEDGRSPYLSVSGETVQIEQNLSAIVEATDVAPDVIWSQDLTTYAAPGSAGDYINRIMSVVQAVLGLA